MHKLMNLASKFHLGIQVLGTFAFFTFMEVSTWLPLRFWQVWGGGGFIDTEQVLRYADCFDEYGWEIYDADTVTCAGYIYGRPLLAFLTVIGFQQSLHYFLGGVFLMILSVILALSFPIRKKIDLILFTFLLISPPVMLLAERGNFDILILGMVLLAGFFAAANRLVLSAILISITALCKFYTAPILIVLLLISRTLRGRITIFAVIILTYASVLADLKQMQMNLPKAFGFGLSIWGEYLNEYERTKGSDLSNLVLGILVFMIVFVFVYKLKLHLVAVPIVTESKDTNVSLASFFGFVAFCSSYFLGLNFDYRLIFLIVSMLLYLRSSHGYESHGKKTLAVVFAISWLSFPSGGLAPFGDLILEVCIASILVSLLTAVVKSNTLKHLNEIN